MIDFIKYKLTENTDWLPGKFSWWLLKTAGLLLLIEKAKVKTAYLVLMSFLYDFTIFHLKFILNLEFLIKYLQIKNSTILMI